MVKSKQLRIEGKVEIEILSKEDNSLRQIAQKLKISRD